MSEDVFLYTCAWITIDYIYIYTHTILHFLNFNKLSIFSVLPWRFIKNKKECKFKASSLSTLQILAVSNRLMKNNPIFVKFKETHRNKYSFFRKSLKIHGERNASPLNLHNSKSLNWLNWINILQAKMLELWKIK